MRLAGVALVGLALLLVVLLIHVVPTARPGPWFDRTPAELRAHASQCAHRGPGESFQDNNTAHGWTPLLERMKCLFQ